MATMSKASQCTLVCSKSEEFKVAPQQKNAWFQFLKSIASFKGDLSSLTAPPFLLSTTSLTEYSTYWAEHPSLLVAPAKESDPEKRALLVLRWFLSTLKEQHNSKDEAGRKKKMKPLNPFLGELFLGKWEDAEGTTKLVTEQVSHHPPATAFKVENSRHGVRLQGHISPKAYFSGTVHIERKGYAMLHIDEYNEDYLITMPKMHLEGILTGSIVTELSGSSTIRSSSGYTAQIEYSGKGWIGGAKNSFNAKLFHDGNLEKALYTLDGQWSCAMNIKNTRTKETAIFDARTLTRTPISIAPIEKQGPMESRRAWQNVAAAIDAGDIFAVGQEKSKIENAQRDLRRREQAEGREFQRRYFKKVEHDAVAEALAKGIKGIEGDMIGNGAGFWVWDEDKVRERSDSGVFV
ncbi:oxysterol-binding protein [Phlyctema vagabunda]|uniref:Oxysterol-binding protein n=1 Tax=Phlyctema vagabunda TaxID=108571 RepID=A0ABR4PGT9_9HELO